MLYYIKFTIIIILFIYNILYSNVSILHRYAKCKWKVLKPQNISNDEEYIMTTKYIDILNSLNIFYYLSFGSELAAFRDGSRRKDDSDVDINIPIWKNYNIFHCNHYNKLNDSLFYNKNVHLHENYTLCGKSRKYYISIMENYLISKWKKYKIKINKYQLSMHVYFNYNPTSFPLHLDFFICMSNEYVYRDLNLCITNFQNTLAVIHTNPHLHLRLLYGNYLIKSQRHASDGFVIHSPNSI